MGRPSKEIKKSHICAICKIEKDISNFVLKKRKYPCWCKACTSHYRKTKLYADVEKKREYERQYRKRNSEKFKQKAKENYYKNRENILEKQKEYNLKVDPQRVRDRRNAWTRKNPDKVYNANKKWLDNNRGHVNARWMKRYADKLQATPSWANIEKIKQLYDNCPEGHEVDHIVPLKGKNVSGFHVENNLQYLTKSENRKKNNKYENV